MCHVILSDSDKAQMLGPKCLSILGEGPKMSPGGVGGGGGGGLNQYGLMGCMHLFHHSSVGHVCEPSLL